MKKLMLFLLLVTAPAMSAELVKEKVDQDTPPFKIKFSEEERTIVEANPMQHIHDSLVAEAKRRKADPMVIEYIRISFRDWQKEIILAIDPKSIERMDLGLSAKARFVFRRIQIEELNSEPYLADLSGIGGDVEFGIILSMKVILFQVVDDSNMLVHFYYRNGRSRTLKWVTGISTRGKFDGQDLGMSFALEQIWGYDGGTRSYPIEQGARKTVACVKPVLPWEKLRPHLDLFKFGPLALELNDAMTRKPKKIYPLRTWEDATGGFSIKATFSSFGNSVVSLKKEDGSIIKVPLEKLSEADRVYIEELRQ